MREIKFRARCLFDVDYGAKEGDWVYGWLVASFILQDKQPILIDSKTIGQFTGLLDKNGQDIYEFDLLKDPQGNIGKVFYRDESACFLVNWKRLDGSWDTDGCLGYGEVVGNIYMNPELIK